MDFLVIAHENEQVRNYVSAICGEKCGQDTRLHLDTTDFSLDRQITLQGISPEAFTSLAEHHQVDRLSIKLSQNSSIAIMEVMQYSPADSGKKTKLSLKSHFDGKPMIVDLPPEAFDLQIALNKKLGLSNIIDLSSPEKLEAFRYEYTSGRLTSLAGKYHQPIDVTPLGVEAMRHYMDAHQKHAKSKDVSHVFSYASAESDRRFVAGPITRDCVQKFATLKEISLQSESVQERKTCLG